VSNPRVVLYGGLSGKGISDIEPFDIIFKDKKLTGFNLNLWIGGKTKNEFEDISNEIQNLIIDGKIKTEIQGSYKLENIVDGIRAYIKSMSAGKVLFKP
jgi:NADPH:quinone reductase-like Zn-dependent oxidoreductase